MPERAVVNAGPLVALSLLDQLDLLPALFAEIWVPQAVFNEVAVAGIGKPGARALPASLHRACMAIIDERRGRRIAQQVYGLPVKGKAGILVEAHRRGLMTELRPQLLVLRVAGYFIADGVIAAGCQAVGE